MACKSNTQTLSDLAALRLIRSQETKRPAKDKDWDAAERVTRPVNHSLKDLDPDAALGIIQDYIGVKQAEPILPGYYTLQQLMTRWGKSKSQCDRLVKAGIDMGVVEMMWVRSGRARTKTYRFLRQ